ncbi:hypothetical protein IWW48_004335 [Coemansia sp. RSA 1200]|nr:hypothetical protein IWW48_004335 [Coemansia sp. RSA 1200]
MSRHRAIRNLDLEEEFYDEDDGYNYDEIGDISEDDQLKLLSGMESVKKTLGPDANIPDQEIKESLWYYYFDEAATVAWLRSKQPGESTGLAGLKGSTSIVGKALEALKTRPVATTAVLSADKNRVSGLPTRQGLTLSQLALRPSATSSPAPVLKNFSGRQIPAPKSIVLDSEKKADPDSTSSMSGHQIHSRRAGLEMSGRQQPVVATLYGQPSPLACFILDGVAKTIPSDASAKTASDLIGKALRSEIERLFEANKQAYTSGAIGSVGFDNGSGGGGLRESEDSCCPDNPISGDISFLNTLLVTNSNTSVKPRFAFDSPSPDDRVFAAQRMAGNNSSTGVTAVAASSHAAQPPPAKASTSGTASKGPNVPTKDISRLRISGEKAQLLSSESESSKPTTPAGTPRKRINVVDEYSKNLKTREILNLVVVGHVDAGKSTLMGHLLYALGQVNERTIKKFERDAEKIGKGSFAYAWVLDETEEERARGVTMDIATNSFATVHRRFTLLDAPGHRDFVPNMISGASRADVAVLVVDASTGEFEAGFDGNGQTREHAILIRSLGVRQLVVAVNKLDMVDWSETRYDEITARLLEFLTSCGYLKADVRFVPVSGLKGVNLVRRVTADEAPALAAWWLDGEKNDGGAAGPCLVDLIDTFSIPERPVDKPFRLAVTDFFKSGTAGSANSVSVSGRIAQGNVQMGEQVVLVPGGERGTVRAIDVDFVSEEWAVAGDSVVLMIQGVDIQNFTIGSVVCGSLTIPIQAVFRFEAQLVIFDPPVPITNGFPALLHIQSLNVPAVLHKIIEVIDQRTGEVTKRRPRHIRKGATARVEITTETPVCLELFKNSKELGRVMLRKNGETIAAGIVTALFSK